MEEIKTYFTIHSRNSASWFLIDTDETLMDKNYHNACISIHGKDVMDIGSPLKYATLRYIKGVDNLLPHPTISDYIKASDILKINGKMYNKKKGIIEERKSLLKI